MILREYIIKDGTRNQKYLEVMCDVCGSVFSRLKRHLKNHTCTDKCNNVIRGLNIVAECAYCKKLFPKPKSELRNSKSGYYFCSPLCKQHAQSHIKELHGKDFEFSSEEYRAKAFRKYGKKCQMCGFDANELALEVHHKDKNRKNNEIENLMVLCANCHSITHYTT